LTHTPTRLSPLGIDERFHPTTLKHPRPRRTWKPIHTPPPPSNPDPTTQRTFHPPSPYNPSPHTPWAPQPQMCTCTHTGPRPFFSGCCWPASAGRVGGPLSPTAARTTTTPSQRSQLRANEPSRIAVYMMRSAQGEGHAESFLSGHVDGIDVVGECTRSKTEGVDVANTNTGGSRLCSTRHHCTAHCKRTRSALRNRREGGREQGRRGPSH
jgi:hypothetical protein